MTETTALCSSIVTKDYDPWFSDDDSDKTFARSVCKQCPVWATCMTFSLINANQLEFGIFAGLEAEERKPLREKMFQELDADHLAALTDKYFVRDIMEPEYSTPSVEAKYRRRQARAETCLDRLNNSHPDDVPRFHRYLNVVTAVVDHPTYTGEELGKIVGVTAATFNEYLRDCFEYFKLDLSVL